MPVVPPKPVPAKQQSNASWANLQRAALANPARREDLPFRQLTSATGRGLLPMGLMLRPAVSLAPPARREDMSVMVLAAPRPVAPSRPPPPPWTPMRCDAAAPVGPRNRGGGRSQGQPDLHGARSWAAGQAHCGSSAALTAGGGGVLGHSCSAHDASLLGVNSPCNRMCEGGAAAGPDKNTAADCIRQLGPAAHAGWSARARLFSLALKSQTGSRSARAGPDQQPWLASRSTVRCCLDCKLQACWPTQPSDCPCPGCKGLRVQGRPG